MGNTSTYWVAMSDTAIITTIGNFIKEERLLRNKTQAQIAKDAGINRWTIGQIEKGESITLLSLIQILRALDILHLLDTFKKERKISPIELAKLERQRRQRARNEDKNQNTKSDW